MDIISLPIEFDNDKIDGRFRLVNIAVQRARELARGAEPKISTKAINITTIALEEAIQNKLEFLIGEEAIKAKEKAKKLDFRKLLEKKEEEAEEMSELEKDIQVFIQEKEEEITTPDEIFNSEG